MGAQGENFRLNWNDFESNLSQAFQELRNDEDFFDVTLATDEDQVGAHRVVLSACSPHLKEMLRRHGKLSGNRTNQLIYLRGVRHSDLLAVLEFMYCGSVNVSQDELNSFLAVAEDLKVKGLTHAAGKDSAETPSTKNGTGGGKRSRVPTPSTSTKKFRPDVDMKQEAEEVEVDAGEEGVEDYGDYEAETSGAVSFDEAGPSDPDATKEVGLFDDDKPETRLQTFGDLPVVKTKEQMKAIIAKKTQSLETGILCLICGKTIKQVNNVKRHFLDKHYSDGKSYKCPTCDKVYNSKNGIQSHISQSHREWSGQIDINRFAIHY